jgi:hypothetical protein
VEIICFWAIVLAVWLFFRLTTSPMRRRWVWTFWTALFLFGGAGVVWSALH